MSVLIFNGYTHATDSVGVKIDNQIIEDNFKKPLILISRWTITGAVISDGSSGSLQTDINNLDAAYRDGGENYGNATFTANGNVHTLSNSTSVSGVRVEAFGYSAGAPWKMHTELSNRRAFYAVLKAEYRYNTEVIAYREDLTQEGTGGPLWKYMPSLIGQPQYQTLQLNTTSKYVQRGMVVLRTLIPVANSPMFPDFNIHHDKTTFVRHAPQVLTKNGSVQTEENYELHWMYLAESYPELTFGNFNTPTI